MICNWDLIGVFLITLMIKIQLRDMASAYAPSSIIPNGVEKIIAMGGIFTKSGSIVVDSAEKAKPVEYAEKIPHATPKPGMNIGNAS